MLENGYDRVGQECLSLKLFTGGKEQISYHNYEVSRNNDFLRNPTFPDILKGYHAGGSKREL